MKRSSLFWGGVLIVLGGLLLLDNLNLLPFDVWQVFWPIVLILLGLRMLWGQFFRRQVAGEQVELPLEGANEARVHLKHGAGRLEVNGDVPAGSLLSGTFAGGVEVDKRQVAQGWDVTLSMPSQSFPMFWEPGSLDWILSISPEVPLALVIDTGASDSRLDLSKVNLKDLKIKTGASSVNLTLPAAAKMTRVSLECGAASTNITIPDGVAAHIRSRGGLSSLSVDQKRFLYHDGIYESQDYETAANKVEIDIQMGVGSVQIR